MPHAHCPEAGLHTLWRQSSTRAPGVACAPSGAVPPDGMPMPLAYPLEADLYTGPACGVRTVWRQNSERASGWRRVRTLWSSHSMLPPYGHYFILNSASKEHYLRPLLSFNFSFSVQPECLVMYVEADWRDRRPSSSPRGYSRIMTSPSKDR